MVSRQWIVPGLACVVGLAAVVSVRADSAPAHPGAQASAITSRVRGFEDTQEWFRHVHNHKVWQSDAAVAAVAKLPLPVLEEVVTDLRMVRVLLEKSASNMPAQVDVGNRRLVIHQLAALLGLTSDELDLPLDLTNLAKPDNKARVVISRLMMRAAILHTAIAVSPAEEAAPPPPAPPPGQRPPLGRAVSRPPIRIQDGRQIGVANLSVHWAIARAALDIVGPPPSSSQAVRLWYHATSARLQLQRDYAALDKHLDHARVVLPSDAYTFLLSGAVCENLAAPPVQSVLAEVGAGYVELSTPPVLRDEAERHLRRALELDPDFALARLHLGRVLQLKGRHADAAEQLRQAESALSNPVWRYFAGLYLGRAERALGRDDEARVALMRARSLFPRAQSPRLELAAIAWMGMDQPAAASDVRALFALANGSGREEDPWWRYDISHVADVPPIWEEMRVRTAEAAR